jgi:hypothetical protein
MVDIRLRISAFGGLYFTMDSRLRGNDKRARLLFGIGIIGQF